MKIMKFLTENVEKGAFSGFRVWGFELRVEDNVKKGVAIALRI